MECRKCGKILSEQERFCTYCGYYSDPNEEEDETEGFSAETIENDRHAVTVTHAEKKENIEVEKVVYENTDNIRPRCLRVYLSADYKVVNAGGFNLCALLFSWIYFIYKKMYIIGIPGLLLAGLLILVQPVILIIYAALSMVLSGIFFNKIYLWFAKKKIDKILSNNNPEEALRIARKAGKDNVLITLGIYFIFLAIIIVLYFTKGTLGSGGDKYWKVNKNNRNTCLKMIDAAKRNSSTSAIAFILEGGCIVLDSANSKYQVYLKFDKGDKIIIEQYSTDPQKMYLDGSTDLLTDYERRKSDLTDSELKYYQDMLAIQANYSKLQNQAKVEDAAIANKTNAAPKAYFLIPQEEVNR